MQMRRKLTQWRNFVTQPTLAHVVLPSEMILQSELIEDNISKLKEISKMVKKNQKIVENDVQSQSQLGDIFDQYARSAQSISTELPQLCSCLRDASLFQSHISSQKSKMDEKTQQVMFTTIDNFINDGLKPATEQKKKFDKEAREYDALIAKSKSLKKSGKFDPKKEQELEQQLQEMKKTYETSESDTLELLRQANHKSEVVTILKIVEYWESCLNFYKEGVQFIESMRPKIEKYKKYARTASSPQGKKLKLFKQPLEAICEREGRRVPMIIVAACDLILKEGKDVQGIFRISATKTAMETLKDSIEESNDFDFTGHNAIDVSGLLKLFLRELPDPLFTFDRYRSFLDLVKIDAEEQVIEIKKIIDTLPLYNYKTIQHITKMCVIISEHSDVNRMTESNLSTVLTPNLLYTKNVDPLAMVLEMEQANNIYTTIIKNYNTIFEADDLELDAIAPKKSLKESGDSPRLKRKKSLRHVGSLREKSSTRRGKKGSRITISELAEESRGRSNSFTDVTILNSKMFEPPESTKTEEEEAAPVPASRVGTLRKSRSKNFNITGEGSDEEGRKKKDSAKKKKKKKILDPLKEEKNSGLESDVVEDQSAGNAGCEDPSNEKPEIIVHDEDTNSVVNDDQDQSKNLSDDQTEKPIEDQPVDDIESPKDTPPTKVLLPQGLLEPYSASEPPSDKETSDRDDLEATPLEEPVLIAITSSTEEIVDQDISDNNVHVDIASPLKLSKEHDLSFTPPSSPMIHTDFLASFSEENMEEIDAGEALPLSIPDPSKEVYPLIIPAKFSELSQSLCELLLYTQRCHEGSDVKHVDQSLRELASCTKLLLSESKEYVRNFSEMKEEITSSSLRIQKTIRHVIVSVKELHKDPSSPSLIDPLLGWIEEFDFCVVDFWESSFFSLKLQLDTHLGRSIQKTASHVSQILRAALSKTLDEESTSNMEVRMKWDIQDVYRLALLRGGLFDYPESWNGILNTLDELKTSIEGFISNSIGASKEEDSDELSFALRGQAKNIVKSFRTIENIIKDDSVETTWDISDLKETTLETMVILLKQTFQDDHSTLESKLLILSVGPYIRRLAKEVTKWTQACVSGADVVDSVLSIKNQVYEMISLVNYHRLDGLSENVESLILTKISALQVIAIQLCLYGSIYALKEDEKVLQKVLLSQTMIMKLIESLIFN